jgi:hypothetical protein
MASMASSETSTSLLGVDPACAGLACVPKDIGTRVAFLMRTLWNSSTASRAATQAAVAEFVETWPHLVHKDRHVGSVCRLLSTNIKGGMTAPAAVTAFLRDVLVLAEGDALRFLTSAQANSIITTLRECGVRYHDEPMRALVFARTLDWWNTDDGMDGCTKMCVSRHDSGEFDASPRCAADIAAVVCSDAFGALRDGRNCCVARARLEALIDSAKSTS